MRYWQQLGESKRRDDKRLRKDTCREKVISFSVSKQMLNCLLCVMKLGLEEKHKN